MEFVKLIQLRALSTNCLCPTWGRRARCQWLLWIKCLCDVTWIKFLSTAPTVPRLWSLVTMHNPASGVLHIQVDQILPRKLLHVPRKSPRDWTFASFLCSSCCPDILLQEEKVLQDKAPRGWRWKTEGGGDGDHGVPQGPRRPQEGPQWCQCCRPGLHISESSLQSESLETGTLENPWILNIFPTDPCDLNKSYWTSLFDSG